MDTKKVQQRHNDRPTIPPPNISLPKFKKSFIFFGKSQDFVTFTIKIVFYNRNIHKYEFERCETDITYFD